MNFTYPGQRSKIPLGLIIFLLLKQTTCSPQQLLFLTVSLLPVHYISLPTQVDQDRLHHSGSPTECLSLNITEL